MCVVFDPKGCSPYFCCIYDPNEKPEVFCWTLRYSKNEGYIPCWGWFRWRQPDSYDTKKKAEDAAKELNSFLGLKENNG